MANSLADDIAADLAGDFEEAPAPKAAPPAEGPIRSTARKAAGLVGSAVDALRNSSVDVPAVTGGDIQAGAMGAAKAGTMDFADEIAGAAKTIGVHPVELARAVAQGPAGLGSYLGTKLGLTLGGNDASAVAENYRQNRDSYQADEEKALEEHPKSFRTGQVGGTLALGAVAPAVGGAGMTGLAYGALGGLGGSRADLTKGDVGGAALDTATGSVVGGTLGKVIGAAAAAPGAIAARFGESKMIGGLTKYLEGIVNRNGTPEMLKTAAGKMIGEAEQLAGDAPIHVGHFIEAADKILAQKTSAFGRKLDPVAEEVVNSAERLGRKGTATLKEISEELKYWTGRIEDLKSDPAGGQRSAIAAKNALVRIVDEATGNPQVAKAAEMLVKGRSGYARGSDAEALQAVITGSKDALSHAGEHINPRTFATKNSGKNLEEVNRLLAHDPDALEAWHMGVEAARRIAKKGKSWLPESIESPAVTDAMHKLMTFKNITKVFTDPVAAKTFMRLVNPGPGPAAAITARGALALIGQISARITENDSKPQGGEKKPAPAREVQDPLLIQALAGPPGSVDAAARRRGRRGIGKQP